MLNEDELSKLIDRVQLLEDRLMVAIDRQALCCGPSQAMILAALQLQTMRSMLWYIRDPARVAQAWESNEVPVDMVTLPQWLDRCEEMVNNTWKPD